MDLFCFGAINWDISDQLKSDFVSGSSNPVERLNEGPGGVGFNVSLAAANLGLTVGLGAPISTQPMTSAIEDTLRLAGIRFHPVGPYPASPLPTYHAILNPEGDLQAGYSEMSIFEQVRPSDLAPIIATARNAPFWFVDCNWPVPVLQAIADAKPITTQLVANLVSEDKAARLAAIVAEVDILIANKAELQILNSTLNGALDPGSPDPTLPKTIVATAGANPCVLYSDDIRHEFAVPATEVVNATGAGDALCAAFLTALSRGLSSSEAVDFALNIARETLQHPGTLPPNYKTRTD